MASLAGWLTGATWRATWTFPVGRAVRTDTCPVLGLSRSAPPVIDVTTRRGCVVPALRMGEPPPSSSPVPPPSSIPDSAEQADLAQSAATTAADLRGATDDRPISNSARKKEWKAKLGQPVQLAGKHPMLQLQKSSFSRAPGGCARVAAGQDGRQASPAWCRGHGGPKRRHWSRPRRATRGRGIQYRQRGFQYPQFVQPRCSLASSFHPKPAGAHTSSPLFVSLQEDKAMIMEQGVACLDF